MDRMLYVAMTGARQTLQAQALVSHNPVSYTHLLAAADEEAAGVDVLGIVESQAPLRREYRPDHPLADQNGYVNMPNVNQVEEMANMISASRSYQSNVEVLNTSKPVSYTHLDVYKRQCRGCSRNS